MRSFSLMRIKRVGISRRSLVSCAVSTRCPTSMVFCPSKDGISHNPVEYSSPAQWQVVFTTFCYRSHSYDSLSSADGAQVLMEAVLAYDAKRTQ